MIIVVGVRCWGAGDTVREALARALRSRSTFDWGLSMSYVAYEVPQYSYVNDFGGLVVPAGTTPRVLRRVEYTPDGRKVTTIDGKVRSQRAASAAPRNKR